MSKPPSPIYRTTNWRSYNAALKQRGSLTVWFGFFRTFRDDVF
ncbi:hypothetical protein AA0498_2854 [Acidomonas methanolica]|nr:hypothetical protein AA0498_2854 [Acidomonas methanolica]